MCLRPSANLLRRKCVIFSCNTQSIPAKKCLLPTQNLRLNVLAKLCGIALDTFHERFSFSIQFNLENPQGQHHGNQQEDSAGDFPTEKANFPQEYFVYFKGNWGISGGKDLWEPRQSPAQAGLVGRGGAAKRPSFYPKGQNEGCVACDDEARSCFA